MVINKVEKPWGYYEVLEVDKSYIVKKLVIYPNQRISLQSHNERAEYWTIVESLQDELTIDNNITNIKKGDMITILPKQVHRVRNCSNKYNLVIIEVQMGNCREDDITRFADDYNR